MTPLIRVERGDPTDDELAAVITALQLALMAPRHRRPAPPPGRWVASARPRADRLPRSGPNAWRRTALPRLTG